MTLRAAVAGRAGTIAATAGAAVVRVVVVMRIAGRVTGDAARAGVAFGGVDGAPLLVGQRQQRIAFGARKPATPLLVREQNDKKPSQKQAEEDGEWDD